MDWSFSFFLIAAVAVTFAGVSKGGFGSGAAFASGAILALVMPPGQALGLMLPLLMLIDLATLRPYWKKWNGAVVRVLCLGAVPGVFLGVVFYRLVNPDVLRFLIGAIAIAFVIWQVVGRRMLRLGQAPMPTWGGVLAGVAAGFTSFVSHAGGPPAAIYLLSRNLGKTEFQASTVLFFGIINLVKFFPYAALGMISPQTALANLIFAPFALIGAWLGVRAHYYVPERLFFTLTYILLVLTGAKLIWDSLT